MKYLYIGVTILALCLTLCLVLTAALERHTKEAADLLQQALDYADQEQFAQAEQLVLQAQALWHDKHGFFCTMLRHDAANEIYTTFYELIEYAQNDCVEEFEPSCAALIEQIRHLAEIENLSYYNILTICA